MCKHKRLKNKNNAFVLQTIAKLTKHYTIMKNMIIRGRERYDNW